jgi:hypothetical protein
MENKKSAFSLVHNRLTKERRYERVSFTKEKIAFFTGEQRTRFR